MPPPTNLSGKVEHVIGAEVAWAAGWSAETARLAADMHKRGFFVASWQLQIDAPSYPPIRAALNQRIAAARSATYSISGPTRAPGRHETEACAKLWAKLLGLRRGTYRDRAMMGLSVWQHPITINPDTLRHEILSVERWPIAAVERTTARFGGIEGYYAIARTGERILLPRPGTTDGHWTVVGDGDQPHLDGAITALDLSFIAGQTARRNFSNLISTMGRTSPIGELPDDVVPNDENGKAFLEMLAALGTEQAAGVHAKGGKVYPFEVTTQTGLLLPQLTDQEARMVAWSLLGHDASISRGQVYADPASQSVPEELTREDVQAFVDAASALFAHLTRLNAAGVEPPVALGVLPDSDKDTRLKARGERMVAFHAAVTAEKANGFELTQERVDALAAFYGVPAPTLPLVATPAPAPTA